HTTLRVAPRLSQLFLFHMHLTFLPLHSFPTRRSSDLLDRGNPPYGPGIFVRAGHAGSDRPDLYAGPDGARAKVRLAPVDQGDYRSEEHTSELQSLRHLVCRLLLEKKKNSTDSFIHLAR